MRKFVRVFAALLMAAGLAGMTAAAASAAPMPVHHRSFGNCFTPQWCIYSDNGGNNFTGEWAVTGVNDDKWIWMGSGGNPGSAFDDSNSAVEVWNHSSGFHECVTHGNTVDLNGNFGWFYINVGVANNCNGVPPQS